LVLDDDQVQQIQSAVAGTALVVFSDTIPDEIDYGETIVVTRSIDGPGTWFGATCADTLEQDFGLCSATVFEQIAPVSASSCTTQCGGRTGHLIETLA
jgi:hypothetical protein